MKQKNAAKRCKYKKNRQSQRIDGLLILAQKEGFEPYKKGTKRLRRNVFKIQLAFSLAFFYFRKGRLDAF